MSPAVNAGVVVGSGAVGSIPVAGPPVGSSAFSLVVDSGGKIWQQYAPGQWQVLPGTEIIETEITSNAGFGVLNSLVYANLAGMALTILSAPLRPYLIEFWLPNITNSGTNATSWSLTENVNAGGAVQIAATTEPMSPLGNSAILEVRRNPAAGASVLYQIQYKVAAASTTTVNIDNYVTNGPGWIRATQL